MADEAQAEPGTAVARATSPTEEWLGKQTGVDMQVMQDGRRVFSLPKELEQRCVMLTAAAQVVQVDRNYSPIPRVVSIDIDRDTYKVGRIKTGPGRNDWDDQVALTSRALSQIAERAGIEHFDTQRVHFPGGVETIVRARYRGPDGVWVYATGSKVVNYEQRAERVRLDAVEKREKEKEWARKDNKAIPDDLTEAELQKQVVLDRDFLLEKAETKAWARAVRRITGAASYPKKALTDREGRFFVLTWSFTPDYNDPSVAKLIDANYRTATAELFEGQTPQLPAPQVTSEGPKSAAEFAAREPVDDDEGVPDEDEVPAEEPEVVDGEADPGGEDEEPADPDEDPGEVEGEADEQQAMQWVEEGDEPEAAKPPKPAKSMKFTAGPYKDKTAEEVVSAQQGREWLAIQIRRMRTDAQRQKAMAWLSWGVGRELSFEDLDGIATAAPQ